MSRITLLTLATVFGMLGSGFAQAIVTLDSDIELQQMNGWEATTAVGNRCAENYEARRDVITEAAVNDFGINRVRLEVRSGSENEFDFYQQWIDRGCPEPPDSQYYDWRYNRYATTNDNDDPNEINWDGYHFTELSWNVENVVLPIKELVEANGEELFINVCYVAFTRQIQEGEYLHDDPEEYAEYVLATHLYLQSEYDIVPNTWEILLEPDNVWQWDGRTVGEAIVASAERLEAEGFNTRFVAPSNTNMGRSIDYFDQMIEVEGVVEHLEELCYHRYSGVSLENLRTIADLAIEHDIKTSMLELWFDRANYLVLHEDLTIGRNSSWQGAVLSGLFDPNALDQDEPEAVLKDVNKFNSHYTKYIRTDAVRIGADSNDEDFSPIAFRNPDDKFVVVIKADAGGDVNLEGLPAGIYGIRYTTAVNHIRVRDYDVELDDVDLAEGEVLETNIPSRGLITVYCKENGEALSELTVNLAEGWNSMSLNLNPAQEFYVRDEGPDVVRLFEGLRINEDVHNLLLLKDESGRFYVPSFGFNSIPYWNLTEGYQVRVDQDIEATWFGDPIPADADIPLSEGWNMIAYYPTYDLDMSAPDLYGISPIVDNVIIIKSDDGRFAVPRIGDGFSNMGPLTEGEGYQVKVDQDVVLNYPEERDQGDMIVTTDLSDRHWDQPVSTGSNMSLLLVMDDHSGSEVAAFSIDGLLVGVGTVSGGYCGLAVWGDDVDTELADGLIDGEAFELRVWEGSGELALNIDKIETGKGLVYEQDGFSLLEVSVESVVPSVFELSAVYPNPFNGQFAFSVHLPEADVVKFHLYDVTGRTVWSQSEQLGVGVHRKNIDLNLTSAGVYFLQANSAAGSDVQRVVMLK